MDATLIRNGFNLERRKMYIENPRHNLRSSVDFVWENHNDRYGRMDRKQQSSQEVKENYQKSIEKKIDEHMKANKSTFRVMPAPEPQSNNYRKSPNFDDSLNKQISLYKKTGNKLFVNDNEPAAGEKPFSNRQSLSQSVFGYDIDRTLFRQESYLSKILGDRLSPYLEKTNSNLTKHQSFSINQPVRLNY